MVTDGQADFFRQPPVLRQQTADHGVIGGQFPLFDRRKGQHAIGIGALQRLPVARKAAQQHGDAAVAKQPISIRVVGTHSTVRQLFGEPARERGNLGRCAPETFELAVARKSLAQADGGDGPAGDIETQHQQRIVCRARPVAKAEIGRVSGLDQAGSQTDISADQLADALHISTVAADLGLDPVDDERARWDVQVLQRLLQHLVHLRAPVQGFLGDVSHFSALRAIHLSKACSGIGRA